MFASCAVACPALSHLLEGVAPVRHAVPSPSCQDVRGADDLVRNSRKRFRRLVNRVAGVWQTAIITKWTAVGVVVVIVAVILIMAVVGSCTVNRALSQNSELRKEACRKAAVYERKAGDEAHASRNEALSRGEGEGR